jgi:hypothetical protein
VLPIVKNGLLLAGFKVIDDVGLVSVSLVIKVFPKTFVILLNVDIPDAVKVDVDIPPLNVSNADAVSGVVFLKYNVLALVSDNPELVSVVKNSLL